MTQLDQDFSHAVRRVTGRSLLALLLAALVLGLIFAPGQALAQGDGSRQLAVGDVVTGSLSSDAFVQVYTFAASAGDTISVDVSTDNEDLALAVVVTDQDGNVVAEDTDISSPTTASIVDIAIETTGTYYVLVMRGSGADGDATGDFTLELSGVQQISGDTVVLEDGGITISLTWAEAVDLNLEVRDPVGGTVHAFSQSAPSGGELDEDVNGSCENATADNPTETITWPAGEVPAGSYEIIIHYYDACGIGGPQEFELSANVNAGTTQTLTGTLNPTQEYVARVIVQPNASWTLQNGGVNAGLNVSLFENEIANAQPIAIGGTVSGTITNSDPAQAYSFDGTAGTTLTLVLQAQSGSLDTYLALLGPDGSVVASNDDLSDSTNSGLEYTLAADGTYTAIVTRYALAIGGTEGDYTLSIAATGEVVDEQTAEPLDPGDATGPVQATPLPADACAETGLTVELPNGSLEAMLTWTTNADLQLLIRDPRGATVYDDRPEIESGAILAADGNRDCQDTTISPVSYIYWPQNRQPEPGIYEVEVWYQNNCNDNSPVEFTLRIDLNEQTIVNTPQRIPLNARFMVTFTISPDGTATLGPSGFFDMATANTLNYQSQLDSATPIEIDSTVSGSISLTEPFELYAFEAQQGDVVDITMSTTGGTLDPALYLIAPTGFQVTYSDDIVPGENRNSAIDNVTLSESGTYYIVATHYGLNVGGTTGTYTLTLTQP